MAGSEGRVYYGETFTAPCRNELFDERTWHYSRWLEDS